MGGAKLVPLCKDVWQNLSHGDTISLLHNDLVFKVVMKAEEEGRCVVSIRYYTQGRSPAFPQRWNPHQQ